MHLNLSSILKKSTSQNIIIKNENEHVQSDPVEVQSSDADSSFFQKVYNVLYFHLGSKYEVKFN